MIVHAYGNCKIEDYVDVESLMFWKYFLFEFPIVNTDHAQTKQPSIDLTHNPAYEVCQQKTHLSAQEPEYNMEQ